MASDYDMIRLENIRKYGEETRHLAFLGDLYSDRTHFVYELLQNAEDVDASSVEITLYSNRLELLHDGKAFDEKNVRGNMWGRRRYQTGRSDQNRQVRYRFQVRLRVYQRPRNSLWG